VVAALVDTTITTHHHPHHHPHYHYYYHYYHYNILQPLSLMVVMMMIRSDSSLVTLTLTVTYLCLVDDFRFECGHHMLGVLGLITRLPPK